LQIKGMPNRSKQADDALGDLTLGLTDLRAHFEAQLRTVMHAEQSLVRCRTALSAMAFATAADAFRGDLRTVAANRKTIGALLTKSVDDGGRLTFAGPARRDRSTLRRRRNRFKQY
jgi:hypothetical protein